MQAVARADIGLAYKHLLSAREALDDAYSNALTAGLKKKISKAMTDLSVVQGTLVFLHNESAMPLPPPKPKKPKPNRRRRRTSRNPYARRQRRTSRPWWT